MKNVGHFKLIYQSYFLEQNVQLTTNFSLVRGEGWKTIMLIAFLYGFNLVFVENGMKALTEVEKGQVLKAA